MRDPDQGRRLTDLRDLEAEWHDVLAEGFQGGRPAPPALLARSQALEDRLQSELDKFIDTEEGLLAGRRQEAERQAWQSGGTIYLALVVAVVASLLIAWSVSLSVTRPIDRLRKAAAQLLAGRFEVEPPRGPNEIAQLIVDFNQIGLSLASTSALREQEEGYRQYIGGVSQLVWRTNAAGEVVTDLPSWQTYTGQTGEQVRGAGWLDAVHPEDRAAVLERWRQAVPHTQPLRSRMPPAHGVRRLPLLHLPGRADRQPGRLGARMDRRLYGHHRAEGEGTAARGEGGGGGGESGQESTSSPA